MPARAVSRHVHGHERENVSGTHLLAPFRPISAVYMTGTKAMHYNLHRQDIFALIRQEGGWDPMSG